MKVELIGVRSIDFTTKEGNDISGIKLFVAYPEEDVYGNVAESRFINVAESRFISDRVFESFGVPIKDLISCIGGKIDMEINPKGKICGITCLNK